MSRVADNEVEALASLYDLNASLLYGVLLKMLGSSGEAEEVLQDVFIHLPAAAKNYCPASRGTAQAWLLVICRRRAIDILRRRTVQQRYVRLEAASASVPEMTPHDPIYEDELILLRSSLAALPGQQRDALTLAYFHGLTHQEISEHLATPLGTIKARLRRGLQSLRNLIWDQGALHHLKSAGEGIASNQA